MKKIVCLTMFLCFAENAYSFDISIYCKKVSDTVGGSYQIEQACRDQERDSFAKLIKMKAPPRIEKYCQQVAQTVGGSYQIQVACIEQELAAKQKLE